MTTTCLIGVVAAASTDLCDSTSAIEATPSTATIGRSRAKRTSASYGAPDDSPCRSGRRGCHDWSCAIGSMNPRAHAVLAHTGIPGPGPFIATGLFFAGFGAAFGAYTLYRRRGHGFHRSMGIVLGVVSFGCFGVATVFPLLLHASPSLTRPSTTARLA